MPSFNLAGVPKSSKELIHAAATCCHVIAHPASFATCMKARILNIWFYFLRSRDGIRRYIEMSYTKCWKAQKTCSLMDSSVWLFTIMYPFARKAVRWGPFIDEVMNKYIKPIHVHVGNLFIYFYLNYVFNGKGNQNYGHCLAVCNLVPLWVLFWYLSDTGVLFHKHGRNPRIFFCSLSLCLPLNSFINSDQWKSTTATADMKSRI